MSTIKHFLIGHLLFFIITYIGGVFISFNFNLLHWDLFTTIYGRLDYFMLIIILWIVLLIKKD